ncbi:MAG: hypothetical protein ACOYON_09000 [Fimbriimonas sp.]
MATNTFEGFFATPFDANDPSKPYEHVRIAIEKELQQHVAPNGLTLTITNTTGLIMKSIIEDIEVADFVVADLRGLNPNVFFEAAFAESMAKPVLYIHSVLAGDSVPTQRAPFDLAAVNIPFYQEGASAEFIADTATVIPDFCKKLLSGVRVNGVIESLLGDPPFLISPAEKAAKAYFENFLKPLATSGIPIVVVVPTEVETAKDRNNWELTNPKQILVKGRDRYLIGDVVKGAIHDWPTNLTPILNFYLRRVASGLQPNLEARLGKIWARESNLFAASLRKSCEVLGDQVKIIDAPPTDAWHQR